MILLTPLALIGLVFLPLLIVLHLRRRHYRLEEVSSTRLWRELLEETRPKPSWMRLHSLPLLLLQLLAVALLVVGLARPAGLLAPSQQRQHVYILDDSLRMAATDLRPNRLAVARQIIGRQINAEPPTTLTTVVVASAQPHLLISSTDRTRVQQALAPLAPTAAPADLAGALRLADGLLADQGGPGAAITLVHAREDVVPAVAGATGLFSAIAVGRSTDNQVILRFSARCAPGARRTCDAFAVVRNEDNRPVNDPLIVLADGDPLAQQSLVLPAHSETGLSFAVPRGRHVLQVHLLRPDILSLDNTAWCVIAAPRRAQVTLVGDRARVAPIRRALAGLPDVALRVRTPMRYSAADAARSDLLVLDGWRPPGAATERSSPGRSPGGGLPPAPTLLLVDPPSLPRSRAAGALADTTVSGLDAASPLLSDVDLTSLDVQGGTAERLTLPDWVAPIVWSAAGPLLAAGDDGTQRLAVLAFDPAASNLPQLSAFPLLLWNVVRWSEMWLPAAVVAGADVLISPSPGTTSVEIAGSAGPVLRQTVSAQAPHPVTFTAAQPGVYTVIERGTWGSRSGQVAANVQDTSPPTTAGPVLLETEGGKQAAAGSQLPAPASRLLLGWWPWIGLAAWLAIAAEWLYIARHGEG
jgi:Ca-activated chloride channel family protein